MNRALHIHTGVKKDDADDNDRGAVAETRTAVTDDNGQKHCDVSKEPTTAPMVREAVNERPAQLPFQVQIRYTDSKGAKAIRVFTETKPVTKDRKVAESSKFRFPAHIMRHSNSNFCSNSIITAYY